MDQDTPPSVISFLPTAILLGLAGWVGLAAVIYFTLPLVPWRWLFFFLLVLALTGTALPFVAFLNRRFPSKPAPTHGVVIRQALWVGIYFSTLGWLQIPRVLTPALALLLAVGLILIEGLLRMRERALWKP
jgi:hypothetical protein